MTDFLFVFFVFFLRTVISIFFIGICTDTSVFEAVLNKKHFQTVKFEKKKKKKWRDVFFAGMKTEGEMKLK